MANELKNAHNVMVVEFAFSVHNKSYSQCKKSRVFAVRLLEDQIPISYFDFTEWLLKYINSFFCLRKESYSFRTRDNTDQKIEGKKRLKGQP